MAHRCEKNYGPGIRGRRIAPDAQPVGRCGPDFDNVPCLDDTPFGTCCSRTGWCSNGTENCVSPLLPPVGPVSLPTSSDVYPATISPTTTTTIITIIPYVPYPNSSDDTCTDNSSAPAITSHSNTNTVSFWPLPTICFDTPTLCGTGPFPWTVHLNKTKTPRIIPPVAPTTHLERPQGFLRVLDPQIASTQPQSGYVASTGATPTYSIPLATAPVHIAQKDPVAQVMALPPDPQAARLERPALSLDIPGQGRVRRNLHSRKLAAEAVPMKLGPGAKLPRPLPQTARAMATGDVGLGGPQIAALDNSHPVNAGLSPAGINSRANPAVLVDRREEDEQTDHSSSATAGVDVHTATTTPKTWDSRASRVCGSADGSMTALMAAMLLALVLAIIM